MYYIIIKKIGFFLLCLLTLGMFSLYGQSSINIFQNDTNSIIKISEAKFSNEDKSEFAKPTFNDNEWISINPILNNDLINYYDSGIVWFRITLNVNQFPINNPNIALSISQTGASEIYYNGVLINRFGRVGKNINDEIPSYLENKNIPLIIDKDLNEHVFAIRFSNNRSREYMEYGIKNIGIDVELTKTHIDETGKSLLISIVSIISGLLFSFGIIHLLLFLFYKKYKANLYYALHVFFYGLIFFSFVLETIVLYTPAVLFLKRYHELLFSPFFLFLNLFLYSLYYEKLPRIFLFTILLNLIWCILFIIDDSIGVLIYFFIAFIIISVSEAIRVIILAIVKKIRGAKILGSGLLLFTLILLFLLIGAAIGGISFSLKNNFLVVLLILLIFTSIISIPLSMSVYLAYNFSLTNKDLQTQLLQVEKLSFKNLEQEKEKKKILQEQNITLEKQVNERTSEIVKQKELIESKQKEILDSIRYAKRIQEAMLPRIKIIENKIKRLKNRGN